MCGDISSGRERTVAVVVVVVALAGEVAVALAVSAHGFISCFFMVFFFSSFFVLFCFIDLTLSRQYSAEEVARMVKQRQGEGVAYKNTALSRIKLSNSLEAAIVEGREEEADFCREQLAKVRYRVFPQACWKPRGEGGRERGRGGHWRGVGQE